MRAVERTRHGPVDGTVVVWDDEEGCGALASPAVEGEVWAHFAQVEMEGYRTLTSGQPVTFTYETPRQDGCPHRAVSVRPRE
jgi:CspA family cold shock protein